VCVNGCGVVSVNVITTVLKMCAFCVIMSSKNRKLLTCTLNQCRVSMRMMLCIGRVLINEVNQAASRWLLTYKTYRTFFRYLKEKIPVS